MLRSKWFSLRQTVFAAGAVAGLLTLSACTDASSGQDPAAAGELVDVSTYQAAAEEAMLPVTEWTGPTTGPAAVPDKKVVFISCGFSSEGCLLPGKGAEKAAEVLGWELELVDGKHDPTRHSRAVEEAITSGADAIILDAITASTIAEPVKRARAEGIVVASYDSANQPSEDGVNFEVLADAEGQGEAMANYMIWKSEGKLNAYMLNAPEFEGPSTWWRAAKKTVEECSSCQVVAAQDFVAGDAATRLPQLTQSALRQNPETNAVIASYDAAMLQTIPTLDQAGLLEQAMVGTFNGISPAIDLVRQGKLTATVGGAMEWGAWATLDNINRVFAGEEPVEQNVPIRLIAAENVDSIPEGSPWTGDYDYAAEYTAIWQGTAGR